MDRRRKPKSLFSALSNYSLMLDNQRCLYSLAKDNVDMIQRLVPYRSALFGHKGCVNSIQWSDDGSKILSGSDDQRILISDPFRAQDAVLVDYKTAHHSNIFCAKFLPLNHEEKVISCAGDGEIIYTDLNATREENSQTCFRCHSATAYSILTVNNEPFTFYSCGEDGTVRFYDIRTKQNCNCASNQHSDDIIISQRRAVTALSMNPHSPNELAIGVPDSVKIYDRRKLGSWTARLTDELKHGHIIKQLRVPALQSSSRSYRITSVAYSHDGMEILASFSSENIYLFSNLDNESQEIDVEATQSIKESNARTGTKKLRLRGDWSDTGPQARPNNGDVGQQRPTLQNSLMERMTMFLSQMLNDIPNNSREEDLELFTSNPDEPPPFLPESHDNSSENSGETQSTGMTETSSNPSGTTAPNVEQLKNASDDISVQSLGDKSDRIPFGKVLFKYSGHRNARTMIKEANFWGDNFIISGSDCGHVFFWDRNTGQLVFVIEADSHVVNCVKPHPFFPILAASGIDYTVKLFAPKSEKNLFDPEALEVLVNRNKVMLEETKDTITVPAAFMIRMLTRLNQIRRSASVGEPSPSSS